MTSVSRFSTSPARGVGIALLWAHALFALSRRSHDRCCGISQSLRPGETQPSGSSWIAASNQYTKMLLSVEFKHHPEAGSRQGLSEYDDKISPPSWADVDQQCAVQSHAFRQEEVERYTYRALGQANSYFYGFTKLLALRKETEHALGTKFSQKKFHDFILAQGLLPPDLMREAVNEQFVSQEAPSLTNTTCGLEP